MSANVSMAMRDSLATRSPPTARSPPAVPTPIRYFDLKSEIPRTPVQPPSPPFLPSPPKYFSPPPLPPPQQPTFFRGVFNGLLRFPRAIGSRTSDGQSPASPPPAKGRRHKKSKKSKKPPPVAPPTALGLSFDSDTGQHDLEAAAQSTPYHGRITMMPEPEPMMPPPIIVEPSTTTPPELPPNLLFPDQTSPRSLGHSTVKFSTKNMKSGRHSTSQHTRSQSRHVPPSRHPTRTHSSASRSTDKTTSSSSSSSQSRSDEKTKTELSTALSSVTVPTSEDMSGAAGRSSASISSIIDAFRAFIQMPWVSHQAVAADFNPARTKRRDPPESWYTPARSRDPDPVILPSPDLEAGITRSSIDHTSRTDEMPLASPPGVPMPMPPMPPPPHLFMSPNSNISRTNPMYLSPPPLSPPGPGGPPTHSVIIPPVPVVYPQSYASGHPSGHWPAPGRSPSPSVHHS